ncbi:cytochrome b6-f complex iron-sulfur subunit [Abditibacteriota bacterium]|nr:cytochrome b6-f complex iron-sulfur subunit [Abditibacteriota bacterium]
MNSSFSRRAFLEGAAATVGAALIAGCGSGSSQTPQAKESGQGYTLANTQLPPNGEAIAFTFPNGKAGLLYRSKEGQSGAVSAVCTHQGCTVEWTDGNPQAAFSCPCHQSKFDLQGKQLGGPAKAPLAHYAATQNNTDIELKLL